jgi:hypothetical protein
VVIPDGSTRRYLNHSVPPSSNMSTASIGSTPAGPRAPSSLSKGRSSLDRLQSRPHTARVGIPTSVSPLSQSTIPQTQLKKEGFAKRWGGKFSLGKKQKAVVMV